MGLERMKIGPESAMMLAAAFIVWLTSPTEFSSEQQIKLNTNLILGSAKHFLHLKPPFTSALYENMLTIG